VLEPFPQLDAILTSVLISPDDRAGILDRLLAAVFAAAAELPQGRLAARPARLPAGHPRQAACATTPAGRVHVRLTTATPLSQAATDRIAENLRALLGAEPVLRR